MITIWDKEYKATKLIKQGAATLVSPFDELARWIASTWEVTVLNAIYDARNSLHAPRLQVILEHSADEQKFHSGLNFDPKKQRAIKDHFVKVIGVHDASKYDADGLFVVFSAFAPLAREEADSHVSENDLKALKEKIANPDLWEIHRCFGHVTFFFYTDAQRNRHTTEGKKAVYAKMYFELLKTYDEFGYLDEDQFTIDFDSKQNFDENYQSSWFNYDR